MSSGNGINGQLLCTPLFFFFSLATKNKYGECVSNEKQTALRVVLLRAQSFWVGGRANKSHFRGYEAVKIKLHRGTSNTANCTHILSYTVPQQLPLDTGYEEVSLIILMALDPIAPAAGQHSSSSLHESSLTRATAADGQGTVHPGDVSH